MVPQCHEGLRGTHQSLQILASLVANLANLLTNSIAIQTVSSGPTEAPISSCDEVVCEWRASTISGNCRHHWHWRGWDHTCLSAHDKHLCHVKVVRTIKLDFHGLYISSVCTLPHKFILHCSELLLIQNDASTVQKHHVKGYDSVLAAVRPSVDHSYSFHKGWLLQVNLPPSIEARPCVANRLAMASLSCLAVLVINARHQWVRVISCAAIIAVL